MAYSDFTFEMVLQRFSLVQEDDVLFADVVPFAVPEWLVKSLAFMAPQARGTEKARSEFIIAPILSALKEHNMQTIGIFSGQSLNVSPQEGLIGECDFLIGAASNLPLVQFPVLTVVEAKKGDIDLGWGQCIAQLVGVQRYNAMQSMPPRVLFGCITTGEVWQFLRLEDSTISVDGNRYFLVELPVLLGVLQACIDTSLASKSRKESLLS